MSIKIGITGGIGSGKSVVSRLFGIMGIPVYISDIEAKRITQTDPVICQELCALVGQDVFQNGVLNRSLLASYMFGHPNRVQKVNEIIHPQVKEDFRRWAARFGGEQLVGMESAILVEAGFRSEVDFLVICLLYTSDAADEARSVDLGGRRIIKKKFFQAEDGIRDSSTSRGLGDVYKRQS